MKRLKRLSSLATASVLSVSALLNIAFIPVAHAAVDTCTWTGAVNNNFDNDGNWSCSVDGNVKPQDGDTIRFERLTGGGTKALVNDLTGVAFAGVTIVPGAPTDTTTYTVDTLTLKDNAVVNSYNTGTTEVRMAVANLTGEGDVKLRQSVVGGDIGFYMADTTGSITLSLTLESGTSANIDPTALTIGNRIVVEKGAYLNLLTSTATNAFASPMTLGGGTGTSRPDVNFGCVPGGFSCATTPVTWNVTGAINVLDNSKFTAYSPVTVNVTGALTGTGDIGNNPVADGVLNVNPSSKVSTTQETGRLENPTKTTTVSDSQPTTDLTVVNKETTILDGSRQNVEVLSGGILKGTGTASVLNIMQGAIVAPGHSPGCINSGNLSLFGTYQAEIGGTTACTGYDQLKVTGTVDLSGSTLESTLYNGFVPTVGQSYTIIDNDVADAVTGTFTGIAEGGNYTNQGVTYSVTYKGGDGNDVVLTVESIDASLLPKAPNTGFKLLAANPMITLITATIAAGAILIARKRLQKAPAKRR